MNLLHLLVVRGGLIPVARLRRYATALLVALVVWTAFPGNGLEAAAQTPDLRGTVVPGFWDPRRRPERPDTSRVTLIRFVTEVDYPPFNYAGTDGNPTGFNVDLARLMCDELKIPCTIQMRRFDTLLSSLSENRADAVAASIAVIGATRERAGISAIPIIGRQAASWRGVRRRWAIFPPSNSTARKLRLSPVRRTTNTRAHFLLRQTFVLLRDTGSRAREALRRGEVDLLFADAFELSSWLNGSDSANCCTFVGGPFTESRMFGEGVGIAVRRGNDTLRLAFNWALFRLWEKGKFAELWLRYFPVNPY